MGLALASSAVLLALLGTLLPRASEVLSGRPRDLESVVIALVLVLAVCGIGLGLVSLARQIAATAGLIRSLLARRTDPPRHVRQLAEELGLAGRIDVVRDRRSFSFCYWFARPRICVSSALVKRLDRAELRAVLVHERYHLAHRDPLRIMLARYFAAGLYVVPVIGELVEHYSLQKEIAADEAAVRETGVRPLARALYKLLRDADGLRLGLLVPVSALSVTEARIEQLAGAPVIRPRITLTAVLLSVGTLIGALAITFAQSCLAPECAVWSSHLPEAVLLTASAALLSAAAISGGAVQLRVVAART